MSKLGVATALACLLVWGAIARGDVITMQDGRTFQGTVLEETETHVKVDVMAGGIRVRTNVTRDRVKSIEKKPLPEGFFEGGRGAFFARENRRQSGDRRPLPAELCHEAVHVAGDARLVGVVQPDHVAHSPGEEEVNGLRCRELVADGPGVRVDSHCFSGYTVPPNYDSMIAKLIAHGATRDDTIAIIRRALAEFRVGPIKTTIPMHIRLMLNGNFLKSDIDIHFVERWLEQQRD